MAHAGAARMFRHAYEAHDRLAQEPGREPVQDHRRRIEPDRHGRQRAVSHDHGPGLHHHASPFPPGEELPFHRVEPPEEHARQDGQVAVEIGNAGRVEEIAAEPLRHGDHLGVVAVNLRVGMVGQVLVTKIRGDQKQPRAGYPADDPVHCRASERRAVRTFVERREPVHHDGAMGQQGRNQPPRTQGKGHQVAGEQGGRQMAAQEDEARQVAAPQQFAQPVRRYDIGGLYRGPLRFAFRDGHGSGRK